MDTIIASMEDPNLRLHTSSTPRTCHLACPASRLVEEDQSVNLLARERQAVCSPLVTRLAHVLAPGRRDPKFSLKGTACL
jgi:hypothetical protein